MVRIYRHTVMLIHNFHGLELVAQHVHLLLRLRQHIPQLCHTKLQVTILGQYLLHKTAKRAFVGQHRRKCPCLLGRKFALLHPFENVFRPSLFQRMFVVNTLKLLFEFGELALGFFPPGDGGPLLFFCGYDCVSKLLLLAFENRKLGLENGGACCMSRYPSEFGLSTPPHQYCTR